MLRTLALVLALAAPTAVLAQGPSPPTPPPPPAQPFASLTVSGDDGAQYLVALSPATMGSGFFDFELTVDCTGSCAAPLHYQEAYAEVPLGLFQLRDADELVYSVGVGRLGYQVRAWSLASGRVTKVLDAQSRSAPDFLTAPGGRPTVRTFAGEGGAGASTWSFRNGVFAKENAARARPATVAPRKPAAR